MTALPRRKATSAAPRTGKQFAMSSAVCQAAIRRAADRSRSGGTTAPCGCAPAPLQPIVLAGVPLHQLAQPPPPRPPEAHLLDLLNVATITVDNRYTVGTVSVY